MEPRIKIDLEGSEWCLVITNTGHRYYHNKETLESVWNYPNDKVGELVSKLNKDELLLKIAQARGYSQENFSEKKERKDKTDAPQIKKKNAGNLKENTKIKLKETQKVSEKVVKEAIVNKGAQPILGIGYESSEDDDDSEEDKESQTYTQANRVINVNSNVKEIIFDHKSDSEDSGSEFESDDSSDDGNGMDLDELDGLESDAELSSTEDETNKEEKFTSLFAEYAVNPFDPWEVVSEKIGQDPSFTLVELDVDRKALFEKWCQTQQEGHGELENEAEFDFSSLDLGEYEPEPEYNERIQFLELLMMTFKPNRFFPEYKKKQRKNEEFLALTLPESAKEKIYMEFSVLRKKEVSERVTMFEDFLRKSGYFTSSLVSEKLQAVLRSLDTYVAHLEDCDISKLKHVLRASEFLLDIPESLREQVVYYCVPTKAKLQVLHKMLHEI